MKKAKKVKNRPWFVSVRKSYLPSSWQGRLIYALYVAYTIAVPITWYKEGHDFFRLLTTVIPLLAAAALLTQFVASKNSK
jgi:hypothetical protein